MKTWTRVKEVSHLLKEGIEYKVRNKHREETFFATAYVDKTSETWYFHNNGIVETAEEIFIEIPVNKNNFFLGTYVRWQMLMDNSIILDILRNPDRKTDEGTYWLTPSGVYRYSGTWGEVGNNKWPIDCMGFYPALAFARWEDFGKIVWTKILFPNKPYTFYLFGKLYTNVELSTNEKGNLYMHKHPNHNITEYGLDLVIFHNEEV